MAQEKQQHSIAEARRYIANAKEILSEKAGKDGRSYTDKKYVKMAGHTAYVGVLEALDTYFERRGQGRKTIKWYEQKVNQTDRKLATYFSQVYDTVHLGMSYDGNLSVGNAQDGLAFANQIIDWVETRMVKAQA